MTDTPRPPMTQSDPVPHRWYDERTDRYVVAAEDYDRLAAHSPVQPVLSGLTRELRIEHGPVVIVQTDADPGDMGEPRIITEDGATVVFVPSFSFWPADEPPAMVPHDHASLRCEYPCDVVAGTLEPAR